MSSKRRMKGKRNQPKAHRDNKWRANATTADGTPVYGGKIGNPLKPSGYSNPACPKRQTPAPAGARHVLSYQQKREAAHVEAAAHV